MSRYKNKVVVRNSEELYEEHLKKRNRKFIRQYMTPNMYHPDVYDYAKLEIVTHTWKRGDRYFKLAHEYYGNSKFWWVIAWFNQKPTEASVELGDVLEIPLPLERAVAALRGPL